MDDVKHLVQFSTGAGSAEVAWRVVEMYGAADTVLLTADTLVEDDDNWRFAREVVAKLGCEWTVLADGRTPMQVGRDERCVPNNRMAVCSKKLKRELLRGHIDAHYDPADTVIYLGYDWTEEHRIAAAWPQWKPFTVAAPLAEEPLLMKEQMLDLFRERGIEPPRLYAQGFAHANCGGACVRGGQGQWAQLLKVNPERYLEWEAEEEKTRVALGDANGVRDVTILRDRRGGKTKPMSLRQFRQRLTANVPQTDICLCGHSKRSHWRGGIFGLPLQCAYVTNRQDGDDAAAEFCDCPEFRQRLELDTSQYDADDVSACGCFTAEEVVPS